jgi:hypothetical protein
MTLPRDNHSTRDGRPNSGIQLCVTHFVRAIQTMHRIRTGNDEQSCDMTVPFSLLVSVRKL